MAGTGAAAAATSGGGVQGRSAADGASGDGSRARSTTLQPAPNPSTPTTQTPRRRRRMRPTPCRKRAREDQRRVGTEDPVQAVPGRLTSPAQLRRVPGWSTPAAMSAGHAIALVGATGAAGTTTLRILEER